ncbi:MAG: tRNA epoxyqueuosine(34) reductase QueG [Candidatus Latescibacteria bacterium]|nr:tRNA epoxyqueuosine(34) reductase QueG [Candidatus Latescibacterota bacterium]
MTLTEKIRVRAGELGFGLVGFAPADPLEGAAYYARWVALGYAGQMGYLERNVEKRADPRQLLPGARSVVCVGMQYFQESAPKTSSLAGRISCYARGEDYHELIADRLAQLLDFVQAEAGTEVAGRAYVDTAPVLERELARRAGLGWWGKNTCLIAGKAGSYFFLGELLLDLGLDYDQPATDHCGTCTRCLDACPTQAFPAPYVLDARRCISYLTIELKVDIPEDLRAGMGDWIFGCDICQQVCPWNRRALPAAEPAFGGPDRDNPSLPELLALDQEGFADRFRHSPLKRAKRRGLLRNAAVALGNSGDLRAVPALVRALADVEPLVRAHATWALGRLGGLEARAALEAALATETDTQVVGELTAALAEERKNERRDYPTEGR